MKTRGIQKCRIHPDKANMKQEKKIMKHSGTNPQITPTKSSSTNTKNTATTATATSTAGSNNNNNNTDKGTVNYREKLKSYDNNFRISVIKKVGKSEWKKLTFEERVDLMEIETKYGSTTTNSNKKKIEQDTKKHHRHAHEENKFPPFVSATRRNTVIGEDKGAISTRLKPFMEKVNEKKMNNTTTTASMSVQVTPTKPETVSFGTSMDINSENIIIKVLL